MDSGGVAALIILVAFLLGLLLAMLFYALTRVRRKPPPVPLLRQLPSRRPRAAREPKVPEGQVVLLFGERALPINLGEVVELERLPDAVLGRGRGEWRDRPSREGPLFYAE